MKFPWAQPGHQAVASLSPLIKGWAVTKPELLADSIGISSLADLYEASGKGAPKMEQVRILVWKQRQQMVS